MREVTQPEVTWHYVQVGDPQRAGEDVALCSCGQKFRSDDVEAMKDWAQLHVLNERRSHRGMSLLVESTDG